MSSQPHPGTREYRNQTVRITDLAVTADLLEDLRFENSIIIGPAILGLVEAVSLVNCGFDAPGFDAMFWPVPQSRGAVMGVIGLKRVEFYSCRFQRIGFAVPEDDMPRLRKELSQPQG